jgi:nucleoside-diphosphate-sugar epimerase
MDGEEKDVPRTIIPWMTDISEVAQARINALCKPEARGRYVIANHPYDLQRVVDLTHENLADSDRIKNIPKGASGKKALDSHFVFDISPLREHPGVEYGPWKRSVINFCSQCQKDRKRFANEAQEMIKFRRT